MASAVHSSVPALQTTVLDLIAEYDGKAARLADEIAALNAAHERLKMAASVQGSFVDTIINAPHLHESTLQKLLLSSGWKAVYNRLQIDRVASAKDKKLFDQTIAAPPPLTFDNAKATFGDYFTRPRYHILRGLAETFAELDPAYKSHSKVRIGVKGLPKRIILTGWGYSGWSRDKFRDILNALATYQGKPHVEWVEIRDLEDQLKTGDGRMNGRKLMQHVLGGKDQEYLAPDRGITVRGFANGNAHVFFDKWTLLDINQALAEFYGEVLPDAEPENVKPSASTAVSKDLQFYWTPGEVAEAALEYAGLHEITQYTRSRGYEAAQVLEPSCGDGRILDAIRQRGHRALGVEYHPGRATQARAKGHNVMSANFLEQPPKPEFDYVVMNPPFYGRHYVKHVRHAFEFLKPGGTLVSILPATAHYDHGELTGDWRDLPVGSFSAAGTNVPTGMLKMRKAA
jgi:hypothetical protein